MLTDIERENGERERMKRDGGREREKREGRREIETKTLMYHERNCQSHLVCRDSFVKLRRTLMIYAVVCRR